MHPHYQSVLHYPSFSLQTGELTTRHRNKENFIFRALVRRGSSLSSRDISGSCGETVYVLHELLL